MSLEEEIRNELEELIAWFRNHNIDSSNPELVTKIATKAKLFVDSTNSMTEALDKAYKEIQEDEKRPFHDPLYT